MSETPVMDELVRELKRINASDWTIDLIRKGQELERALAAERERADRNQRDAERLDFLAEHRVTVTPIGEFNRPTFTVQSSLIALRECIDAARRK